MTLVKINSCKGFIVSLNYGDLTSLLLTLKTFSKLFNTLFQYFH